MAYTVGKKIVVNRQFYFNLSLKMWSHFLELSVELGECITFDKQPISCR